VLSEEIYKSIIEKANDNTYDVLFQGNFYFAYHNNNFILQQQSSTNAFDIEEVEYIPISEITSTEVTFTESNNRSDFTKVYEFAVPHYKTDVPKALQELRDYYFANPTFTVVDEGTTYNGIIKISRPNKSRDLFDARSGKFVMLYSMIVSLTVYDSTKGTDANLSEVLIDTYEIPYTSFTKGSKLVNDPSNKVTDEANTSNKPYARGIGGTFTMIHDKSTVADKIYKALDGDVAKQVRDTTFTIKTTINAVVTTVTAYIWGTYSLAPNNIIIMNCEWVVA